MRLMRDSVNGMIAGVCEGLANRFNVSAGTVRFIAVLGLLFSFGFTALLYLLLWVIIPNRRY
jgi:phage shock protein PspC (stress-responsive transcriptional regulator)